jgi:glucosamine kinase
MNVMIPGADVPLLASRFVGVDGGQSEIRLQLAGATQVHSIAGVTHLEGNADAQFLETLGRLWEQATEKNPADAIECIALGLTTEPSSVAERADLARAIGTRLNAARVRLTSDATIAHLAALPDRHGISLVVGTGIACLGVDAHSERTQLVDGDGFLLGDRGGAFWIGRRGIAAALAAADGRGTTTAITSAAMEAFGAQRNLATYLHGLEHPVNVIAQFAAQVQQCAAQGDEVATGIIDDAARELVASCVAASRVISGDRVPLAVTGRAAAPETPLFLALRIAVEEYPRLELVPATGTPIVGAVLLSQGPIPRAYAKLITEWSA